MRKRNWFWRALGGITAVLVLLTVTVLLVDYRKTVHLRNQIGILVVGTADDDVLKSLGEPDATWNGSRPDETTGDMIDGYTIWIYCSRFDWDGQRSRWNDASFVPYWLSRIAPSVDDDHDAVVELWFRNGSLEAIENSVIENLLGRNPTLSL